MEQKSHINFLNYNDLIISIGNLAITAMTSLKTKKEEPQQLTWFWLSFSLRDERRKKECLKSIRNILSIKNTSDNNPYYFEKIPSFMRIKRIFMLLAAKKEKENEALFISRTNMAFLWCFFAYNLPMRAL